MNWKDILLTIGPTVLSLIPATRPIAAIVPAAVAEAEDMLNASGREKKAAALELVHTGVKATNATAGRQVIDPDAAHDVADNAIDAIVATTNLWSKTTVATMSTIS